MVSTAAMHPPLRRWVRIDKTQREHNESAYPPIADIQADFGDGSEVPNSEVAIRDL
jgi:hypothetical protein